MNMNNKSAVSRRLGIFLLTISLAGFVLYVYLMLFSIYDILVLKLTMLCFVAAIVGVIAWMGYTMITTKEYMIKDDDEGDGKMTRDLR